jgi:hypothetical protein
MLVSITQNIHHKVTNYSLRALRFVVVGKNRLYLRLKYIIFSKYPRTIDHCDPCRLYEKVRLFSLCRFIDVHVSALYSSLFFISINFSLSTVFSYFLYSFFYIFFFFIPFLLNPFICLFLLSKCYFYCF